MNWKIAALALVSVLVVGGAGTGIYLYQHRDVLFTPGAPAVVQQVERLNELVTVKYKIERVVGLTEPKSPFGEESILLMVQGEALAGVDLTCLSEGDVRFTGARSLRMQLPRARLMSVHLDESQSKVWDRHVTWWTPWVAPDPDLEHKARLLAIQDIETAARRMGILNEAQHNAEIAVAGVLGAAGLRTEFPKQQ